MASNIMNSETLNIAKFFGDKETQYVIPNFQRPYSWEEEDVKTLLKDLEDYFGLQSRRNGQENYYVGAFYTFQDKYDSNIKQIIDGQQRVIFFYLYFLIIFRKANEYINSNPEERNWIERNILGQIRPLIFSDIEKETARLQSHGKLDKEIVELIFDISKTNNGDKEKIHEIMKNKLNISFNKKTYSNYEKATKIIEDHIDKKYNDPSLLLALLKKLQNKVSIVEIHFDNSMEISNIFKIFEKINATGKKLSDIDLVKNFLFYKHHMQDLDSKQKTDDEKMCDLWAKLIEGTNNNLEHFFQQVISTQIKYYKTTINFKSFKTTWKEKIQSKEFDKTKINSPSNFLEWLVKCNLQPFIVVSEANLEKSQGIMNKIDEESTKIKIESEFYLKSIKDLKYKHSQDIAYIALKDYMLGYINGESLVKMLKHALVFPIKFQTIMARDSKDKISVYEDIINYNINEKEKGSIAKYVVKTFDQSLAEKNINESELKSNITKINPFSLINDKSKSPMEFKDSEKKFTRFINMAIELGNSFDEERFNNVINKFKAREYHLDHFIPVSPKKYPFTWEKNGEEEYLKITKQEWFKTDNKEIEDEIRNHIDNKEKLEKNIFISHYLNVLGNMNIKSGTSNIKESNREVDLEKYNLQYLLDKTKSKMEAFFDSYIFK